MPRQRKLSREEKASRLVYCRVNQAITYRLIVEKAGKAGMGVSEWLRKFLDREIPRSHHKET